MYFVKHFNGTQWHVLDNAQQTVFIGNKQRAEDWLDLQENLQRQQTQSVAPRSDFLQALLTFLRRVFSGVFRFRRGSADSTSSVSLRDKTTETFSANMPSSLTAEPRRGERARSTRAAL